MSSQLEDAKEKKVKELEEYRLESFTKLLGEGWPLDDIVALFDSDKSVAELRNLLENGCSKELAVKILL